MGISVQNYLTEHWIWKIITMDDDTCEAIPLYEKWDIRLYADTREEIERLIQEENIKKGW